MVAPGGRPQRCEKRSSPRWRVAKLPQHRGRRECLFAARDALFGLILVAEASEHCVTGQQPVAEKGNAAFALAALLSRRGLERPCEALVAWAREA